VIFLEALGSCPKLHCLRYNDGLNILDGCNDQKCMDLISIDNILSTKEELERHKQRL
jgi:hypothetical protein